jgi:hypothetical protein
MTKANQSRRFNENLRYISPISRTPKRQNQVLLNMAIRSAKPVVIESAPILTTADCHAHHHAPSIEACSSHICCMCCDCPYGVTSWHFVRIFIGISLSDFLALSMSEQFNMKLRCNTFRMLSDLSALGYSL